MRSDFYKGHSITYKCGWYWTLGQCFIYIKKAKKHIDTIYPRKFDHLREETRQMQNDMPLIK